MIKKSDEQTNHIFTLFQDVGNIEGVICMNMQPIPSVGVKIIVGVNTDIFNNLVRNKILKTVGESQHIQNKYYELYIIVYKELPKEALVFKPVSANLTIH